MAEAHARDAYLRRRPLRAADPGMSTVVSRGAAGCDGASLDRPNSVILQRIRSTSVRAEVAAAERTAQAIQQKLDRLDEAFLFARSIDIQTYDRHSERLREELTLARISKHSTELEELDVEGILAFAERVLPRAADLWVQAQLDQRQRFQQLFFPEGLAFDGERLVGTGATAPAFSYFAGDFGG
jgi:hypothetical protein